MTPRAWRWAALAVAVSSTAAAQTAPWTLPRVLDRIDRAHPLLSAAERERAIADAELLAAEGAFDPTWRTRAGATPFGYYQPVTVDSTVTLPTTAHGLSLFAGYRLGVGTYTGFPTYDGRETNALGELRAGVSLPLWRNGSIDRARATIARAEVGRDVASLGVAQQRLELRRAGTVRYWEWVAAGRRLDVARSLLALATERDEALAARVSRGDLPAYERADNQRAVAQREGLAVAARRALEQSAIELSLFLRDDGGRAVVPGDDALPAALPEPAALDVACAARAEREAPRRRPETARLEALRTQQDIERRWADNQRRPAVDLSVAASQDLGAGPDNRRDAVLDVALTVEVPVRNRVATGRERAAREGMARAEDQLRFARDRVEADVRDARSALEAARQRVDVARREHELAQSIAQAERQRFAQGEGTLLFVNLREQASAEAALRVIDALAEYHRARAAWHYATATDARAPGDGCLP